MDLIWWFAKLQCGIMVHRLTYENLWTVDRLSNLLLGIINIGFVLFTYTHHVNWLIPLGLINTTAFTYAMANKNIFQEFLLWLGFEEKEKVLLYRTNQLQAKEKINEKEFFSFTTNQANVFVFDASYDSAYLPYKNLKLRKIYSRKVTKM
jgi:hypothetical protein